MAEKIGLEAVLSLGSFSQAVRQYNQAISGMGKNTASTASSISSSLAGLGTSILNIGAVAGGATLVAVTALGAALATFAVSGIKQAIDLDQQVANIAATMGATKETAGVLKDELKGLALDLSLDPNLTVNVEQAGQAIQVLAANGALATDEFGRLTQGSKDLATQTVALANATGSDFATAANIATDASNLFGLKVDEMGKAVDGAAGIMNASKFDANDYQLALANAGGIAAQMGVSLEDFNTVIAGTASNFASGSDAGTSFKVLLQRLANPTDEVKTAMERYGISLFDANGNMRDMTEVAQDLNQIFNGTVTVASQVGGATKEQAKAAEQASSKIGDLSRDIELNKDKLKLMTDVYQESLKFYDAGEPKMRNQALAIQKLTNNITDQEEKLAGYQSAILAVDGAQTKTITSTEKLTEAQKAELAAVLGGADGSRILLGLAELTGEEFDALSESVNRSGQGLEAAALRVDTVKGAMDIFKGVLQAIQIQIGDKFLPLLKNMALNFTQLATTYGPQIVGFFGQVADKIDGAIVGITKITGAFERFGVRGAAVSLMGMLGFSQEDIGTVSNIIRTVTAEITHLQEAFQRVQEAFQSGGFLGAIFEIGSIISQAWITTIQPALALWGNNFFNWLLYDVVPAIPGQVTSLVNTISEKLRTGWDFISSTLTGWGHNFFNWVTETVIPSLPGQLDKLITAISEYLNSQFPAIGATFDTITTTINEGLTKIQGAFTRFGTKGAAISLLGQLGMDPETIGKIDTTLTSITEKITTFIDNVMLAYSRFGGEGAAFSILGQLGVSSDTLVTLKTTLDEIVLGVQEFVTQIQEAFAGGAEGDGIGGGFAAVFESLKTSIAESLPTLAGEILANIPTVLTNVTNAIAEHFRTNVPAFQEVMTEWTPKFWEWVNTAIDGAGAALAGILLALTAWATSPEAQSSLSEMGNEIGKSIVTGLGLLFENVNELTMVMVKLSAGLAVAAATLAGDMILIGGQLVAGILSGMLEEMGVNVKPAMISELQGILQGLAENSMTIIREVAKKIVKALADSFRAVFSAGMDVGDKIREFLDSISDILTDSDKWLEIGKMAMEGLLSGIKKSSGIVLEYLKSLLGSFLDIFTGSEGLDSHSPSKVMMDIGKDAVRGLQIGAENASGALYSSLGGIAQGAIDSLMTGMKVTDQSFIDRFIDDLNMGGIAKAAGTGGGQWRNFRNILKNEISANMQGLADGTISFMDKITEVANRFQFPPNLAREFAQMEGLVGHLTGTFGVMFQKLRIENLVTSTGLAQQFAGIGASFADMVKGQLEGFEQLKEGAAKLREENGKLTASYTQQETELTKLQAELLELTSASELDTIAIEKKNLAIEKANETLGFQERQLAILRQELAELTNQEEVDTIAVEKKQLAIDKLVEGMDSQKKQLAILQEELLELTSASELDTVAIEKKQAAINKLTAEMDKNRQEIEKNEQAMANYRKELAKAISTGNTNLNPWASQEEQLNNDLAMAELLQEFLDSGIESLRLYGNETEGIFANTGMSGLITRVYAQEELNRLLAEQAERQQQILEIEKAQKQLDFLSNQINLIKMLSDKGLNPRDILGGITLGIDASAEDLLEATNRVVQAMINQINADLQIASPSKVMGRIGGQVMAGMAKGIERGKSMLTDTVRNIPLLNGSIPQPVFSQQGGVSSTNNNVYNYNFPMTVNTSATASGVMQQYEIKRSMYAN